MPNRRTFLKNSSTLLAGSLAFPGRVRGQEASRPNILVVSSDQEYSKVDRRLLNLPNRERIESRGIRFTNAFCTTPQCSASRATMWTGRYPHETGTVTNVDGNSLGKPLPPSLPNLANQFAKAGYETGYLGKWHLSDESQGLSAYGFPGDHGGRALDGEPLANAAAEWINQRTDAPWLLVTSFINPHDVYKTGEAMQHPIREGVTLPPNFNDTLKTKPSPQFEFLLNDQGKVTREWGEEEWLHYRSYYLHLIEKVDAHLGVILDALQNKGMLENTVVVYTSDHGDMGGAHRLPFKGPFMYEELLNVPLVISYPAVHADVVETDALASLVDLVPTLCRYSGVSWDGKQSGVDLSPLYANPNQPVRREIFAEYYGKQKWVNPIRTIRTQRWKYNRYLTGGEELYDLQLDPGELKNLAPGGFYNDTIDELRTRLENWQKDTGDPL